MKFYHKICGQIHEDGVNIMLINDMQGANDNLYKIGSIFDT